MIVRKTYNCVAGETSITDASLAYVTVHRVAKSDNVYFITVSEDDLTLSDFECRHSKSFGGLYFKEEIPFNNGEKINVVYEN